MAVGIDGSAGDYLSYATPPGYNAAYTIMGWWYFAGNGTYQHAFHLGADDHSSWSSQSDFLGCLGNDLRGGCAGGTANSYTTGSALTNNTWYHVAMVRSSSTSMTIYLNGVSDISFANNVGSRAAATHVLIGQVNNFPLIGRLAGVKAYTAALSAAEVLAESYSFIPSRWANLWAYLPMWGASPEVDYSGNDRSFTVVGTLTHEDNPPIGIYPPWGGCAGWQGEFTAAVAGGVAFPFTPRHAMAHLLVR